MKEELHHLSEQLNKTSSHAEKNEKDKENYKTQLTVLKHDYSVLQDKFKDVKIFDWILFWIFSSKYEHDIKMEMSHEMSRLHKENEKYMSNQNKLKVISDIQSLIRSHRKNHEILQSPNKEE